MDRRHFLNSALALSATATAATTLSTPAIASGKRELKMVTTWPKNFPGLGNLAERLAQAITVMSDGRITVKVYAAGELVPTLEAFDAVSTGPADLYHAADYYWQGKAPAYAFFTGVPFGLTAAEMDAWILYGGGAALWDEVAKPFNIKPLLAGNTGQQMAGWYNKELNSLDDFKGLKIRMPGIGGDVLRKLGANAINLPGPEIFPAMESGAIDATDWVGPWNDLAFGLNRAAKYYYHPGVQEPSGALCLGVNTKVWESLSKADQKIFEMAALAENNRSTAEFRTENARALKRLEGDKNVELRAFSDDILEAMAKAAKEVMSDIAAKDALSKKVADSFNAFRADQLGWSAVADEGFLAARRQTLTKG